MKTVDLRTTDGTHVEINPNAISEIVEVEKAEAPFLLFPGKEAEYQIDMLDGKTFRVEQSEVNKLKNEDWISIEGASLLRCWVSSKYSDVLWLKQLIYWAKKATNIYFYRGFALRNPYILGIDFESILVYSR